MDRSVTDADFQALATFRRELRTFLDFSAKAAQAAGLAPRQHQALLAVRGAPDQRLTVGALAESLLLQPHSASELVSRLTALGLVDRSGSGQDSRQRIVGLTPQGRALLDSLSDAHRAELRRLRPMLVGLLNALG